jgi:hypothetical protein
MVKIYDVCVVVDKRTWWLLLPRFSALIQFMKHQADKTCFHVFNAVSIVTRGHEMVKKHLSQKLAPTGII